MAERIAAANSAVSVLQEDDLHTPSHYAKIFKDLCKEYDCNISLLNFDDFKMFIAQEDKAMREDIKELLKVHLNKVTKLYETAQHNKNITKILMERVSEADSAVSILQEREDLPTSHYHTSLYRLVQVIQNMEKYIEEITQDDRVQNLRSTTIEKKFKDLREEYDDSISSLNFNLAVDFKSNAQEKDKILLKSQAALAESMIVKIFNEVIELYKTTRHNKNTTRILMERISEANSAVIILQEKKDLFTSHYYTCLQKLIQILQDMEEYTEEITLYDTVQNSLKAKTIEKKFSNLFKEYGSISLLNFVDFKKFNAQEEDEVLKEDIRELLKFQATSVKNTIYKILNGVTELYKTAQHDKKLAEILKERISVAHSAVGILQGRDDLFTSDYYIGHTNLYGLVHVLQNMEKYVEEITQYDTKRKFAEAKTIEEKFKDLCKGYDRNIGISLLNFNLAVDFKFNAQEEEKGLLKFQTALAKSMIDEILKEVEKLHKTAQHNKNITKILMERISEANSAVSILQERDDLFALSISDYYMNLQKLVQVSQDMKKYIEEITQYITVQEFLGAESIEEKFKDLRQEYDTSIGLLNFVEFKKFNAQEEDKVLRKDIEELLKFQADLAESMTDTNMDSLFVPLINDVAYILRKVTNLYCIAQHNKQITKILMERIAVANSAVSIYILREDCSYTLKDFTSLQRLVRVLQDMKEYIEEITQYNAVQEFSGAESIEKKFKGLREEYDTSIGLLNFVDFKKFNAQEEDKVLKEDIEKLQVENISDVKLKVANDKLNIVIKQVSEMAILINNKKDTNQNKTDNAFYETPLSFEDYEETDKYKPRSDLLRKYVNVKTKEEFAFKTIDKEHINQVQNQVKILKKLEHCQNIIHFYGLTYDGDKYYLVTEWAENGNLREFISKHGQNIEIRFRLGFAYDIAKGLNFLNAIKILHRDIRSENIVITDNDVAKITNFHTATENPVANKECIRYRAPEILKEVKRSENKTKYDKYDAKCEVYSFGILLLEIAECKPPYSQFEDIKEITKKVISGYRESFTSDTRIPGNYKDLVNEAVDQNPNHRPTFAMMLINLQDIFKKHTSEPEELPLNAINIEHIKWDELTDMSEVGSGGFGSISKARWVKEKDYVAIKKLHISSKIQKDAFQREIQMQIRVHDCDNIIRFIGITQPPDDKYCIVMEYADSGDLRDYLAKKFSSLDWDKKYQLALNVTNGVRYLHKEDILHRDLHAKNIVIHKGIAKITDFGLAKSVEIQTKIHKGVFGMVPYVAPELLNFTHSSRFSKKTDIYSLGVLLWELSSGYPPFEDYSDDESFRHVLIHKIIKGGREVRKSNTPPDYYELYIACWNGNPEERPIIEDVYNRLNSMLLKNNEDTTASIKNTIAQNFNEVTKLYETAQHNKNITKTLMERMTAANSILQDDDLSSKDYSLRRLVQVLQDMKKYIEEITQYNAVQEFLGAESIEEKFKDLRQEYDTSIDLLNLVDFKKFNLQEENKVLKEDVEKLAKKSIFEILNEVTKLLEMAQHNKNITKTLMERIDAVNYILQDDDLSSKDYTSLQRLVQVLQDMKNYIEDITEITQVQNFLENNTIEDKFIDLREEYDISIGLLNFVGFKEFNTQDEDKILSGDVEELLKFQAALAESMTDTNMDSIYFKLFAPLIKDVADILNNVMGLYCTAQHNKKIAKILIERIATANSAFNTYISRNKYTSKDCVSLQSLVQVLKDMKDFIEEITQNSQKNVDDTIEKKFKDLCKEYDSLLNFVEFNAQEEDKILKEDIQMKQKETNVNDKMKLVSEMASLINNKKDTNQNKTDNAFYEPPLTFEDYEETDKYKPRSDLLRKYVNVKSKEEFAFKTIVKEHINQIKNQVTVLKKLEYCQNIIHFYGLTYDGDKYYLVTEWAENGNLREYIEKHGQNLKIEQRLKFAYDIVKGLNFLNVVKILHRDIRSENIIITGLDIAKITNFNAATENLVVNKECIRYRAPEILKEVERNENKTKYDTKCEVYSFGILLWEIAECKTPYSQFDDIKEIAKEVISGYRESFTKDTDIPKKYKDLVNEAVQNPDRRPTFAKMLINLQDISKEYIPVRGLSSLIKNAELIKYIKWSELADISEVGFGGFGSISKALWSKKDDYVVVKKLHNSSGIHLDAFQREIQMQIKAHNCDNIIRFIGITREPPNDNYCIVMEYADSGDLRVYLAKNFSSLDWDQKYQLAFDITNGVRYLHEEDILHRDLHAKNIVIHKKRAKITDFGLAKGVETQTKIHKEVVGIAPYVAPELFNLKSQLPPFSKKTDVYSLGVLLWEISSGKPPFKDYESDDLLITNIRRGMREEMIPDTPIDYHKLYTNCWNKDPEKRPIIEDVYNKLKCMLPKSNETTEDKVGTENTEGSYSTLVTQTQQYSDSLKFDPATLVDSLQSNDVDS